MYSKINCPARRCGSAHKDYFFILSYNFAWEAGVYTSAATYDPQEHAKNYHQLLFKHASKFHRSWLSLIIFVHFPWLSEKLYIISPTKKRNFIKNFREDFLKIILNGISIAALLCFESVFNITNTKKYKLILGDLISNVALS